MAIPKKFPDPNDRSFNNPKVIVNSDEVLGLYNQENKTKQTRVTKPVREWFENEAKDNDWDEAEFTGNQCTLEVKGMKNFHSEED